MTGLQIRNLGCRRRFVALNGSARAEPCLLAGVARAAVKSPMVTAQSRRGRSARRRHRPRDHAGRADGRPIADRDRARLRREHLALDGERAPRQARQRAPACRHAQAPLRLLPHRLAARRAHAGEHQAGRGDRDAAAPSAALGARRRSAPRPHLLRSSGRPMRRRNHRRAGRSAGTSR